LRSTLSSSPSDAPEPTPTSPSRRARFIALSLGLGVVLVVGGVTAIVVTRSSDEKPTPGLEEVAEANSAKVGQVAPDFELETLDGGTLRLSDYRGRPVVLNFWASWCTPCRKEFPMFRETVADKDGAFAMIGVDTGDVRDDARQFVREQRANWPNGFDAGNHVARGYGVDPLPQTFFIRADGTIASHVIRGLDQRELDRELKKIGVS
jgi:cytochrome c biogenesis protein CcmG, thiol:disulfide interchange protein DsbE